MEDVVIIGDLEIWPEDLGTMSWFEANTEVAKLGPGWRLPTLDEFNYTLWPDRVKIPGLGVYGGYYWSSTEYNLENLHILAWTFWFHNGTAYYNNKSYDFYIRPVRDLSTETVIGILLKEF